VNLPLLCPFKRQGRFLDLEKASVRIALREHVNLLQKPGSISFSQIHDVTFRVTITINEFIQNGDRGVLDNLSKKGDAREEGGTIAPASVDALAKGGAEVPVECFFRGQLRVEKVVNRLLECGW
jgi:hypothetical protein